MPAFATDVFGAKNAGTIYGAMLTAWSAGAIVGPLLIAAVPYRTALPIIVCMLAVANILPVLSTPARDAGRCAPPSGSGANAPRFAGAWHAAAAAAPRACGWARLAPACVHASSRDALRRDGWPGHNPGSAEPPRGAIMPEVYVHAVEGRSRAEEGR
jgi:hypothetical protein